MIQLLGPLVMLAAGVGPPAELSLPDQHGAADSLVAHRGHVVVVMVVDARRLRSLKAWEQELRNRYDALRYPRVADVTEDPAVSLQAVADKLRRRVPPDVSVLIDLQRRWARALELDTRRPNLLIFDREGRMTASFRGLKRPELLARVFGALDELHGRS